MTDGAVASRHNYCLMFFYMIPAKAGELNSLTHMKMQ